MWLSDPPCVKVFDPAGDQIWSHLGQLVLLAGRASRPRLSAPLQPAGQSLTLAPVAVEENRIIRRVVGLRPFRPGGFVVRAKPLGHKLLVHNYGHGGGGFPLSWGTAELAAELAAPLAGADCAVLGCGAVGLA